MLANIQSQRTLYKNTENAFSNDDDDEDGDDNDINNDLAQSPMLCLYLSKKTYAHFFQFILECLK